MKHVAICVVCACVVTTMASANIAYSANATYQTDLSLWLGKKFPCPHDIDSAKEYVWERNWDRSWDKESEKEWDLRYNNCFPTIIETHGGSNEKLSP